MGGRYPACPALPDFLLGDLRRRWLDTPTHPRHRGAPQAGDRHRSGRASHLRRGDPWRDRRLSARLRGRRPPPYRGAARRSAGGHGRQVHRPSRRLRQRRRAGGRPEEDRRLPDQRRGLPRKASRFGRRTGRPGQSQAQGRCRCRPLHHPVLLRGRRFPALPRSRRHGRRECAGGARHHAGVELPGGDENCRPLRLQGAELAGPPVRRAGRRPRDTPHDRRHRRRRPLPSPAEGRRRPVPFLYAEPCRSHLRHLPPAGRSSGAHRSRSMTRPLTRAEKAQLLRDIGAERILVKDGPYGSMIQSYRLDEEGFRAGRTFNHDQKGNNDLLNLTRPEIVGEICNAYLDAGADIVATNTFNSNAISLSDYGIAGMAREINIAAAKLTRACADAATARDPARPRFVAGALGPTNKTLSVSPVVNDPGFRAVSFDEMKGIYREQIDGLLDGGVDFILIETVFDTLNAKAALVAADEAAEARGEELPGVVSMTLTDLAGRNLSGQTVEAFWHSVRHSKPLTMGLNCSFGATELHPYVNALNPQVDGLVCVYPNAGLPNELGAYDEPPEMTAKLVKGWAEAGWLNVVGGCCGTTPAHIKAVAEAVKGLKPRQWHVLPPALRLSGMEAASFF